MGLDEVCLDLIEHCHIELDRYSCFYDCKHEKEIIEITINMYNLP